MKNFKPYSETNNIYNKAAEIRRDKQKKREKRSRILLWIFNITIVTLMTVGLHIYSVWRNGREGIGGEAMIPVIAVLAYLSYRQMKVDERNRQARRKYYERKHREAIQAEFKEYDRITKDYRKENYV